MLSRLTLASAATQLLDSKVRVPPLRIGYVARPRLLARLDSSERVPLTLVSGPAGFGKTTLLAAWAARAPLPVAWLSLEASDDDAARFLLYLCAALQAIDPQSGADAGSLLQSGATVPHSLVLTTLLNGFAARTEPLALVLDDTHLIESGAVVALLAHLVEHCPPCLHLLIATRADPDLPLARYRARGQLNEIRVSDLRFTLYEAGEFLNAAMTLNLTRGEINALEARTEGWIAGLQLAALSLRDHPDHAQFITAFSGSHRYILDFLLEQVLSQQSPEIQLFLLRTSILERMNATLCHAVTGQNEAQGRLEWLEAHNLFVLALDDTREWYRYHTLFAEVLQHRLRQSGDPDVPSLHRRASEWFERHGYYADAVHHALQTNDYETIARIVEQVGIQSSLAGQPQTVGSWLALLPQEMVVSRPMLACAGAVVNLLRDRLTKSGEYLEIAEQLSNQNGTLAQLALVHTWQAVWRGEVALQAGDLVSLIAASRDGLRAALPDDPTRLVLLVRVARAFQITGDVTTASENELQTTLKLLSDSGNLFTLLNSIVYLGRLQTFRGQLRRAGATYARADAAMPLTQGQPLPVFHPGYYWGLADLYREWNELERAEEYLKQGFALTATSLSVDADALVLGYTVRVRVHLARGEYGNALEAVNQLAAIGKERRLVPACWAQIAALSASVELARGNLQAAAHWASALVFSTAEPPDFLREPELITWARVRLALATREHDNTRLPEIGRVLEHWCQDARAKMRLDSVIQLELVRARIADALGRREQALGLLESALKLGEPENYQRVFADEGAPLRRLLLAYRNREAPVSASYLASLLTAMGAGEQEQTPRDGQTHAVLLEPLSGREIEVLRLIVRGASNQEIAEALVIALPTVKRHISTIYAKLNVTSRTQAIARAQELKLV